MLAALRSGFAFYTQFVPAKSYVYVDGFNLYYGAAKHTPFKWVSVTALAQNVLPQLSIAHTRYFTALVKPNSVDQQQLQRQQIYLRALNTLPNLSIHYGHYLRSTVTMPLESPPPNFARVIKMEEKGSDVNIATYMLVDAFQQRCEQLVLRYRWKGYCTNGSRNESKPERGFAKGCTLCKRHSVRRPVLSHGFEPAAPKPGGCKWQDNHKTGNLVTGPLVSALTHKD